MKIYIYNDLQKKILSYLTLCPNCNKYGIGKITTSYYCKYCKCSIGSFYLN